MKEKIMKKIYILILIVVGVTTSCSDYLDSDMYFKDRRTIESTFKNKTNSEMWLAHVFSEFTDMNADVASKGFTPHCFADDMYYGDRDREYDPSKQELSYNEFRMGIYTENDKQDSWFRSYRGIRNATTFIQYIYMNEEMTADQIEDYRGQARFARAYLYWLLLRKYGPIPILPNEGIDYTNSYDDIATPRSTYEECAEYISNEMSLAAKEMRKLGMKRTQDASARPTCGAALATRAKALLYAASPLANGQVGRQQYAGFVKDLKDDKGRLLLSTDYNDEKWAKAAAAARDVMELGVYELHSVAFRATGDLIEPATITPPQDNNFSGKNWPEGWADIDPYESYRQVFNGKLPASSNPELIFTRGNNGGEGIIDMVFHQLPRFATGFNTHGLTQKQVDSYYMNNGTDAPGKDKEIGRGDGSDRLNGYVTQADLDAGRYKPLMKDVSLQYANREPRFYASVAFSGSFWNLLNESKEENRNKQIFYYSNNMNGFNSANAYWLRTGVGVKKFIHPNDTYEGGNSGKIVPKPETAIRYADILLIYAEALNELDGSYNISSWDGSASYAISRNATEIKKGIHPVRIRAGVPDYPSDVYASKDKFRERLKRERQIELMGEGQRYYDLRRWMDAPVEEALPIYGCNVLMAEAQRDLFYKPVAVWSLRTTFADKMWFWPIMHSELKRNKRLTQNPGWTYND